MTTMMFTSLDAVAAFAGEDYTTSVVPSAARQVLAHFDAEASHYELVCGMGTLTPPALRSPGSP